MLNASCALPENVNKRGQEALTWHRQREVSIDTVHLGEAGKLVPGLLFGVQFGRADTGSNLSAVLRGMISGNWVEMGG